MDPAASADLAKRLERALAGLPPLTREIFLAVRLDQRSYAEIASTTGLGVGAVERHVLKAIRGLSRAVDSEPARWREHLPARWRDRLER